MKYIIFKAIMGCLDAAGNPDPLIFEYRVQGLLNILPSEVHKQVMSKIAEFNFDTEKWNFERFCMMKMGSPTRLLLHNGKDLEIKDNDYSKVNWNEVYSPRRVKKTVTDYDKLLRISLDELEKAGINWPKKPSDNKAIFSLPFSETNI